MAKQPVCRGNIEGHTRPAATGLTGKRFMKHFRARCRGAQAAPVIGSLVLALFALLPAHNAAAQDGPLGVTVEGELLIQDANGDVSGGAVLPNQDWTPLFGFTLTAEEDEDTGIFAQRILTNLRYTISGDNGDGRGFGKITNPAPERFLEWGLFRDFDLEEEEGPLLNRPDRLIVRWDHEAAPIGEISILPGGQVRYELDFIGAPLEVEGPRFPDFGAGGAIFAEPDPPARYIVAFRTSSVWRSTLSVSLDPDFGAVINVDDLLNPITGESPVLDEEGEPVDQVPEDPIGFENENGYVSIFNVFDMTGPEDAQDFPLGAVTTDGTVNEWIHPRYMYTPLDEHFRPRFDLPGNFFDAVTGEFLFVREMISMETWTPVIALNMHGVSVGSPQDGAGAPPRFGDPTSEPRAAGITEINVVLTDIGADPFGPPGNGGFDPRTMLDPMTNFISDLIEDDPTRAVNLDFTFNGLGVFHDTGSEDPVFNLPELDPAQGVVNMTDFPMVPDAGFEPFSDPFETGWEYVPFPPGGGDPWWKIKLPLVGVSRAGLATDSLLGALEPVPDFIEDDINANFFPDYFIVVRLDSGFQDISLLPGDGTGVRPGADFRAFIEPRRFNPAMGSFDGGIHATSMMMPRGAVIDSITVLNPWQNDERWDFPNPDEPWFNQRTLNRQVAKPIRFGVEVHDMVLTYQSNNQFSQDRDTEYGDGFPLAAAGKGQDFFDILNPVTLDGTTNFSRWLDPFGTLQQQFFDLHAPGSIQTFFFGGIVIPDSIAIVDDDIFRITNFSYETAPFFNPVFDVPPLGPRSSFFAPPNMLNLPTLPDFSTWLPFQDPPSQLPPGRYPSESDWEPQDRRARLLRQRIDSLSGITPILGINVTGADDPVTNRIAPVKLEEVTVAFYGENFTPSDLVTLDPTGLTIGSGLQLFEDTNGDGSFLGAVGIAGLGDTPVPVRNLAWRDAPEPVDLDGDGEADDLNGDGVVDTADMAWVLQLRPNQPWQVPTVDDLNGGGLGGIIPDDGGGDDDTTGAEEAATQAFVQRVNHESSLSDVPSVRDGEAALIPSPNEKAVRPEAPKADTRIESPDFWTSTPATLDAETLAFTQTGPKQTNRKVLAPGGSVGLDLFVTIRTSNTVRRFEEFQAFVPATLPSRSPNNRRAGVQFTPRVDNAPGTFIKRNPDENPVQDWFGNNNLLVNVPTTINRLTSNGQTINPGSEPVAVLGLDMSTNRGADGLVDAGESGTGTERTFEVPGAGWEPNAFEGYFLIDSTYESFEIVGNSSNALSLLSGTPATGGFFISRDPSFFEYLIVEFYDEGNDVQFDIRDDLRLMDIDPTISGLAIYRDNDFDPSNRNGQFDPGIDIPIELGFAPFQVGVAGEPQNQFKLVFASPGTDDVPQPGAARGLENQPRRRQWVPDHTTALTPPINTNLSNIDLSQFVGNDFFVVIRTSDDIEVGDDFRVGIVPWGPPTPSSPDPDTFPPPPAAPQDEFDKFQEYPWGNQAVGFVTMFTEPPDLTGFNFIRTTVTSAKATETDVITSTAFIPSPDDVVISSASPQVLPPTITEDTDRNLVIFGDNFGTSPRVVFEGTVLTVVSATNNRIDATLPVGLDVTEPVTLSVTNTSTGNQATRDDLFLVGDAPSPRITAVDPERGNLSVFPVTITGQNFFEEDRIEPMVFFDDVKMVIQPDPTATTLRVDAPPGGLPRTGPYDVRVVTTVTTISEDGTPFSIELNDTLPGGFFFENPPAGPGLGRPIPCFIATAAYGTSLTAEIEALRDFRDETLLQTTLGSAFVDVYYAMSPGMAEEVAKRPWLAGLVRVALTPIVWMVRIPWTILVIALVALAGTKVWRRRQTLWSGRITH